MSGVVGGFYSGCFLSSDSPLYDPTEVVILKLLPEIALHQLGSLKIIGDFFIQTATLLADSYLYAQDERRWNNWLILFIEKLRAGTTQNDSDSGSEVARKFNDNFEKVAEKFTEISEKLASGLSISVNGTVLQANSEGIVELPLVSPTQAWSCPIQRWRGCYCG